jgi:hypothetical protein
MKHRLLFAALLLSGVTAESGIGVALADSKDGIFPSADQVGGQVYPEPIQVGAKFPTDFDVFDSKGNKVDLGQLLAGKRTVLAFFISAVPASVHELRKLQDHVTSSGAEVQVLNLNADTVGVALEGGPTKAVAATAKTVELIKREEGLSFPMFVAPNDALSPTGLSNRLGFRGLPTIFVLNAQGMVEKVFVGPQQWKRGDIS